MDEERKSEEDVQDKTNENLNKSQSSTIAILSDLEHLIVNLNHTAMEFLRNDQFALSIRLLNKAEHNLMQVNEQISEFKEGAESIGDMQFLQGTGLVTLESLKNRLLGLTYNNLGCVCKQ